MVLIIPLVLLVAACGDDDAATTTAPATGGTAPTAVITISGFDFGDPISVTVGQTVEVRNDDGTPHTWTSTDGGFDSGPIGAGESFTHSFAAPGVYPFLCEIHTSMTGEMTVTG
ncbi:MAG TPA: amidase [Actinobacteria bacterium]|nr:amidase [Actinomycetota bacterium]